MPLLLLKNVKLVFEVSTLVIVYFRNMEGTDAGTETDINLFHELYYHFLGTDQSEDILCWRDLEHAAWTSNAKITDDGQV